MKTFLLLILTVLLALCVVECQKKILKTETVSVKTVQKVVAKDTPQEEALVIDMAKGPDTSEPVQKSAGYLPIYFDYDKAVLTSEARETLLAMSPNFKGTLVISGHCDERGTDEYNQVLGARRAERAKDFLAWHGFDANRIKTESFGKRKPIRKDCTDEPCHAENRRAEFHVQP